MFSFQLMLKRYKTKYNTRFLKRLQTLVYFKFTLLIDGLHPIKKGSLKTKPNARDLALK